MERFAFLIHPLDIEDIYRKYKLLKVLPRFVTEKIVQGIAPSIVSCITNVRGSDREAEGWFVGLPLTSKLMVELPEEKVINRIIEAGKLAERKGAKILGLGAFTSVVGDAGITVAQNLNIAVTTGNTYTVAAAFEGTLKACELLDKDITKCHFAILGATGSIGKVCSRLAADVTSELTLIGRDINKLDNLKEALNGEYIKKNIRTTTNIKEGLENADVIITVTSSVDEVIKPNYLKTGAIICDVARPRDVSKSLQNKRKDVLVIEGGVIEPPNGVAFNFNFGFPEGLAYACMAETMILALEGRYENFSIGRDIELDKVYEINKLAKKHGFKLAGLRSFERVVDAEYINAVKLAIQNKETVWG